MDNKWPSAEMQKVGHAITKLDQQARLVIRDRIQLSTAPGYVRQLLAKVTADPYINLTLKTLERYAVQGHFYNLDYLGERPQPQASPGEMWEELHQELLAMRPDLLEKIVSPTDWESDRQEINTMIGDSLRLWCELITRSARWRSMFDQVMEWIAGWFARVEPRRWARRWCWACCRTCRGRTAGPGRARGRCHPPDGMQHPAAPGEVGRRRGARRHTRLRGGPPEFRRRAVDLARVGGQPIATPRCGDGSPSDAIGRWSHPTRVPWLGQRPGCRRHRAAVLYARSGHLGWNIAAIEYEVPARDLRAGCGG